MYILFEKNDSRDDSDRMSTYDAMGYSTNEPAAIEWVSMNPEYRCYKYCPSVIY